MNIDHLAIWTDDIEAMRAFYVKYFNASCSDKYVNPQKNYTSYFLSFSDSGCRIELMHRPNIAGNLVQRWMIKGLAHFALSAGNRERVDELTERLRQDGYIIAGEPRVTGDGYYESAVLDPEGNYVELIA